MEPRSRRKRRQGFNRDPFRWVPRIALGLLAGVILVMLWAALTPLPAAQVPVASEILDARGRLVTRLFVENRSPVPLQEVPLSLRRAVVAIEDFRFYRHRGIDPLAIARALARNIQAGRVVEGGSTITQQLAKNLFLSLERTLVRKVQEALLTIKLETRLSKDEILELYLNQIYLGHGTYGVEVAAETYFDKPVRELNLAESAMLAGLIRSPERFSPYRDPEAARGRQEVVLERMAELGMITPQQVAEARATPIRLAGKAPPPGTAAGYFVEYVTGQLVARHPEIRMRDLFRGGFKIFTTLDVEMQRAAEQAFQEGLGPGTPDEKGVEQPQGALVAVEPATGYIKAMVGGRDFGKSPFNRALARRQPGSAFKPFLYTAVIDSGYTAAALQRCEPVTFPGKPGESYTPTDYGPQDYHYRDFLVREAIAISDNVVAVRWAATVGPRKVVSYARLMGIESPLEPTLPLVLGASEVSPLEMAAAISTLANTGYRVEPQAILRVVDPLGRVIEENRPRIRKVLDEKTAWIVTDLLKSVLAPGGTGSHLAAIINRPAAGKTGTTSEMRDAWFVGYTPRLAAAVYVGHDDPRRPVRAPGGALAGPIWARFMRDALAGEPPVDFPRPAGIVEAAICPQSGLLAPPGTPAVREVFVAGTEPREFCPMAHAQPAPTGEPAPPIGETPPPAGAAPTPAGETHPLSPPERRQPPPG